MISKAHRLSHYLRDVAILIRIIPCLGCAAATLLGGYLLQGLAALTSSRVLKATISMILILAAANIVNDIRDIEVDARNKPARPIPAGRISPVSACVTAGVIMLVGLGISIHSGWLLAFFEASVASLSILYSLLFKGTVLFGNLLVGLLAASPILYGAMAQGQIHETVIEGLVMVFLFMSAFEVLKTLRDKDGDAESGVSTIATEFGAQTTIQAFQVLIGLFTVAVLLSGLRAAHPLAYFGLMFPTSVLPSIAVVLVLHRTHEKSDVRTGLKLLTAAWFPGLVGISFLR